MDYSEWDSNEQFKLNDDTEEKVEEKEEEEAEKGMFKKLFEKFKNWVRKLGKRRTQDWCGKWLLIKLTDPFRSVLT